MRNNLKWPKKLYAGYQTYDVVYKEVVEVEGKEYKGLTYPYEERIFIKNEKITSKRNTLLHESLHALNYSYGLLDCFKSAKEEERYVNAMANALMEYGKHNPSAIKIIFNV